MIKNNWWKYYFNKDYLELYYFLFDDKRTKKEIDFIINILRLKKEDKILDLCCGWGRHMIGLAERGYNVVGIDYSKPFLRVGKNIAKEKGVKADFIYGDICKFLFKKRFDVILNLFTSFGYFSDSDNRKIIENISKSLNRKGKFIIDTRNICYFLSHFKSVFKYKNGKKNILENHAFNPITFQDHVKLKITEKGKQKKSEYILRLYSFPEIKKILEENGLRIKKVYGSYEGENFDFNSKRMIIVGVKI
ncbi:MAG: class I SAM-dependent methyltransferase [bacterium]|nr:class I SAM-dependent methyltransferase [bacterium]